MDRRPAGRLLYRHRRLRRAAPRTGALLFMALLLAGQLFVALLLDHFGWAGFRQSPISLGKVAGLLLIFGGVWLIQRG